MVKNMDKVTGEANELFQSMVFVYLNHKKNLKMEKSCKIWVWHVLGCGLFGHFLVKSWFFDYIITVHTKMDFFIIYELNNDDEKCRTIGKFEKFLHFRAENTHLSAIGSDQQSWKRVDTPNPKEIFTYFYL